MVDYSYTTIRGGLRIGYLSPAPQEAATFHQTKIAKTGNVVLGEATVNASGQNWNFGTIGMVAFGHNGASTINNAGTFYNAGLIAGESNNTLRINGGSLVNSGELRVCSGATITAAVSGHGVMDFLPPGGLALGVWQGRLELDGSVGRGQVVDMTNDGDLVLGDVRDFHAVVKGFTASHTDALGRVFGDTLSVKANATTMEYANTAGGGSVLKLSHGMEPLGSVAFSGRFANGVGAFSMTNDGVGSVITLA